MFRFLRAIWKMQKPARAPQLASRWAHFTVWALLSTLICAVLWGANWRWSSFLDNAALDALFALRGAHSPAAVAEQLPQSRDIIIVELRHEVPRDVLALLLPKLKQARAVGLDLTFADRKTQLSDDEIELYQAQIARWNGEDQTLARAIERSGNVVLGAWNERVLSPSSGQSPRFRWNFPAEVLQNRAQVACHLGVVPDVQDGIIRRVRLFETIENRAVPAFGLALAALYRGETPQKLAELHGRDGDGAALLVNYLGPRAVWEYDTRRIVFERALEADEADFAGRIVLVGQTDDPSKDILPTPFGDMPGVYIHAGIVATLLDEAGPPQLLAPLAIVSLSLLLCLILVATLTRFPVWMCAPVGIALLLLAAALAGVFFARWNWILPLSVPCGALFLTYNGVALYEYRRARGTLGRVVGSNTAARLLDDLNSPHLGGKLQIATAFFCDLRGYSTFSEQMPPEELIALLNRYTAAVVREVQAFGGRPIDYFGDGVFVLFEPQSGENHALRAVRAALATQRAVAAQSRSSNRAQGVAGPTFVAGIALHTGPMVIGLVGADNHFKPGAVGDAVNVAARLQSLSEPCGFPILLSRATLDACGPSIEAAFCGEFPIKGRQGLIDVFGLEAP